MAAVILSKIFSLRGPCVKSVDWDQPWQALRFYCNRASGCRRRSLLDEALRPVGVKSGQFSLLISLDRRQPLSIGSVAKPPAMDRTTLTANLKPLERRGLIAVTADSRDRRTRRLEPNNAGRRLLAQAVPIWKQTHGELENALETIWVRLVALAIVALQETSWYVLVACLLSHRRVQAAYQRVKRTVDQIMGAVFVALGARIVALARI